MFPVSDGGVCQGTPKPFQPFYAWDPKNLGVAMILLGIFQVLLTIPAHVAEIYPISRIAAPFFLGIMFVASGALSVIAEKTPQRNTIQACLWAGLSAVVLALVAVVLYSVALNYIKEDAFKIYGLDRSVSDLTRKIVGVLIFFDLGALIPQAILCYSALKGLRSEP